MHKRIILSDREELVVDFILKFTDWEIGVLILNGAHGSEEVTSCKKKYLGNTRIEKIITQYELLEMDDFSRIDYSNIRRMKPIQPVMDYMSRRIHNDLQYSKYTFYNCMSYLEQIIIDGNIDCCIITGLLHGLSCDYLLGELARQYNIQCYVLQVQGMNLYSLLDYNHEELLPLCGEIHQEDNLEKVIDSIYYYYNLPHERMVLTGKIVNRVKQVFVKSIFLLGGNYLLTILYNIWKGRWRFFEFYAENTWVGYTLDFVRCKYIQLYARRLYSLPDMNSNYIIYFLHFEPEAVITNEGNILDSQLVLIAMLSQSLPEGWNLYVKEHPLMQNFNYEEEGGWYIPSIPTFYTKFFLDKIVSFKNTHLIPYTCKAPNLINCSRAVASLNGTVLKEGIVSKKPVIFFGNKRRNILGRIKGVYCVESMESLRKAIKELELCSGIDYEDYVEQFKKYLFVDTPDGWENAVQSIEKYFEGR